MAISQMTAGYWGKVPQFVSTEKAFEVNTETEYPNLYSTSHLRNIKYYKNS